MQSWFRRGVLLLAVIGLVKLAAVHYKDPTETKWGSDPTLAVVSKDLTDDFTSSIGTVGLGARDMPALSSEQLGWIFLGVINLPDVPELAMAAPASSAALPDSIELQSLPAIVTHKIPQVKDYKFVKLDDRILLVSPESRAVVGEIPRYKLITR